jgi:hypothetical protein
LPGLRRICRDGGGDVAAVLWVVIEAVLVDWYMRACEAAALLMRCVHA